MAIYLFYIHHYSSSALHKKKTKFKITTKLDLLCKSRSDVAFRIQYPWHTFPWNLCSPFKSVQMRNSTHYQH